MTAGEGGGTDNARVFANTIHDINGFSDGIVFSVNDDSDNNEIFNNLLIGDFNYLVGNFGDNEGSGNQIHNNIITGNMGSLFENSGVQGMFSVTSQNTDNTGTSFINLGGSVPDEYYSLTQGMDGTGTVPDADYLGDTRSDPPDVGAFEYGGAPPQTCSQLGGVECCTVGETCEGTSYSGSSDCISPDICCSQACGSPPQTCTGQGFYCCTSGYDCSDVRSGTGCGTGETCCASQGDCTEPPPVAPICDGLLLLHHYDGDASDSSDNGNDGTVNGATLTTGMFGQAYSFGSGDDITISSLQLPGQFTYSAWINPQSQSGWDTILTDQGTNRWLGLYDMVIDFYDGSSDNSFGSAISSGAWHHVVLTSDGSEVTAYLDGSQVGSPLSASYSTVTDDFLVGNNQYDEHFAGSIDELAVWGRALSSQEVQDIYSSGSPINCQEYHPADTDSPFCQISIDELLAYIELWKQDSTANPMRVLMEGIGYYYSGDYC
jgi:hypothetical protein